MKYFKPICIIAFLGLVSTESYSQWKSTEISKIQNYGNRIIVSPFYYNEISSLTYSPQLGLLRSQSYLYEFDTLEQSGIDGDILGFRYADKFSYAYGTVPNSTESRLYKSTDYNGRIWKIDTIGMPRNRADSNKILPWGGMYFNVEGNNIWADFMYGSHRIHYIKYADSSKWVPNPLMKNYYNIEAVDFKNSPQSYYLTMVANGKIFYKQKNSSWSKWTSHEKAYKPIGIRVNHITRTYDRIVVTGHNATNFPVMYSSEDAGITWKNIDLSSIIGKGLDGVGYQQITAIQLMDDDIYVALSCTDTSSVYPIYKSGDFGYKWEQYSGGLPKLESKELYIKELQIVRFARTLVAIPNCGEPYYSTSALLSIEESKISEPSIFPNPSRGVFNVDGTENISQIEVYDRSGRLVLQTDQKRINLEDKKAGIYTIAIYSKDKVYHKKLLLY